MAGKGDEFNYRSIGISCSLSETPLRQAAMNCGPSFSYTLHVTYSNRFEAYELARRVQIPEHPFAPYINVALDAHYAPEAISQEWWLTNDTTGESYGSPPF